MPRVLGIIDSCVAIAYIYFIRHTVYSQNNCIDAENTTHVAFSRLAGRRIISFVIIQVLHNFVSGIQLALDVVFMCDNEQDTRKLDATRDNCKVCEL